MPTPERPSDDFPIRLSNPAIRALVEAGYTRFEELNEVSQAKLAALHGMGPKGIRIINEELKQLGLGLIK